MEKLTGVLLLLAALNVSLAQDKVTPKYFKDGGGLTLDLSPRPPEPITQVLWMLRGDLVAEWVKDEVLSYFKTFIGRTTVDVTTGRLVINSMTKADMGVYSAELNNKVNERYYAVLIKEVPQPEVWVRPWVCSSALDGCTLACEADPEVLADAGPVTYSWKKGDGQWTESEKDLDITMEETAEVETFTCRIQNPVSAARESEPRRNPFLEEPGSSDVGKIVGGSIGGIGAAAAVVALVALCCCNNRGDNSPDTGSTGLDEQHPAVPPSSDTEPQLDDYSTCLNISTAGCWKKEKDLSLEERLRFNSNM